MQIHFIRQMVFIELYSNELTLKTLNVKELKQGHVSVIL